MGLGHREEPRPPKAALFKSWVMEPEARIELCQSRDLKTGDLPASLLRCPRRGPSSEISKPAGPLLKDMLSLGGCLFLCAPEDRP